MTCQSSEATDAVETNRRADDNSRAVESDESRIALAMKDLKNTGEIKKYLFENNKQWQTVQTVKRTTS